MLPLHRSWLSHVALLAVVLVLLSGPVLCAQEFGQRNGAVQADSSTVAVIAGAPYDELLADINFLGSLMDQPQLGQLVEMQFAFFVQSIDRTKPWGVIVQTDGMQFTGIACLPVTRPDDLLAVAPALGAQVTDVENGIKRISLPNERSFYVRSEGGWSFIGQTRQSLDEVPADPEREFANLVADYDLSVRVLFQNVPPMYRSILVAAMQTGMQQGMQPMADETPEQFEARQELTEAQLQQVIDMINELDTLTFGWTIDAEGQRSYVDFLMQFTSDGKMATQFNAIQEPQTDFAGFYQPSAVATMTMAQKVDLEQVDTDWYRLQQEQSRQMMTIYREQVLKALREGLEITDEAALQAIESAATSVFDVISDSVESGKIDAGAALDMKPGEITLVAGAYAVEPNRIQAALEQLSTAVDELEHVSAVETNVARHGDVAFHRVTIVVPEDQAEARETFGDQVELAIGVGQEAVYAAFGHDHMQAVQQAIDASRAEPGKRVPMLEVAVSLGPIMEMAAAQAEEGDQRELAKSVATMLREDAQGRDHLRMTGQAIEHGLRYRIELEEGVLRAIGKAGTEAQRRQMQLQ